MTQRRRASRPSKRPIESYDHRDKDRLNNPPVGLVTPETDRDAGRKTYAYDPHLDPQLQWAGKAEHTSFEVPTVSLHVHERIDPRTIIEATRKRNGNGAPVQGSLFELPEENPPVRNAIEFYRHRHNWTNRLVAGDSLLVMNSLLEKEGMAGKVQMVYIDPPYGIRYGSNFQPFVNKRDVKDGNDDDLTQEPETIKAFRDTWELGIHSYLSYLRDRLLVARGLLTESGSCFVQISDENVHLVRSLMDEVFGRDNFLSLITYRTSSGTTQQNNLKRVSDYIIWYCKDRGSIKFRRLLEEKTLDTTMYNQVELKSGQRRPMVTDERRDPTKLPAGSRPYQKLPLHSMASGDHEPREVFGAVWRIPPMRSWRYAPDGFARLLRASRIQPDQTALRAVYYQDDYPAYELGNSWQDTGPEIEKSYVVQTSRSPIERCVLMTTDPGDLVFDPTCGSGTTAYVAEQWGRRWITCDTSRVALSLAKQRLMTALFDYYELAHPNEGVGSGFKYKTVPHVTLRSIAQDPGIDGIWEKHQQDLEQLREKLNAGLGQTWGEWEIPWDAGDDWTEEAKEVHSQWWQQRVARQKEIDAAIAKHAPQETLYDQPLVDTGKKRVTGPFSVEAVPAQAVKPIDDVDDAEPLPADDTIARSGETLRQADWRDELLKTGIRGKAGQFIRFARLEPLPDYRHLHADGESLPNADGAQSIREGPARSSQRIVVSFGPDHAPLEQRQVNQALQEAETLRPQPKVIVFAAFQFDPEAAKDIDETNWPGMTLLKAQMNADLLTEDLKRKRASNESFWLIGQPDVYLHQVSRGQNTGKWQVVVQGFDYYNTKTGDVESGGEDKIAMWMLDTDYDGRSLYPRQVFFPMSGANDGWARLARNLRTEIDEGLIEAYRGTVSLPFEAGENRRIAVKIIDDRGIESLKVIGLDAEPPATKSSRTLEDIFAARFNDIPQEEWDRLPRDLIDNLDHYTAGADKDTDRPGRTVEEILEDYAGRVPAEDWAKLPPDLIERLDYYTSGADV